MKPELQKLLDGALKLLSIRPHSRKEIELYLHRRTNDQSLIDKVIIKLDQHKLLNDHDFAQWLVDSRSRSRPRGRRLLFAELKNKGIDPITINNLISTNNELSLATTALTKKLPLWSKLPFRDYFTKATRYLASRGFSWDTIEQVVKTAYNEDNVN